MNLGWKRQNGVLNSVVGGSQLRFSAASHTPNSEALAPPPPHSLTQCLAQLRVLHPNGL